MRDDDGGRDAASSGVAVVSLSVFIAIVVAVGQMARQMAGGGVVVVGVVVLGVVVAVMIETIMTIPLAVQPVAVPLKPKLRLPLSMPCPHPPTK
jgi:hypothetical protein